MCIYYIYNISILNFNFNFENILDNNFIFFINQQTPATANVSLNQLLVLKVSERFKRL